MPRTILPLQLVPGGDRRITHGVALARDAISAACRSKAECGILDTELVAAFCNMVSTWYFRVMLQKGLHPAVIDRYLNLYTNNNRSPCKCLAMAWTQSSDTLKRD